MLNCIPLFAFELQILVFRSNITILSRQQNNKICVLLQMISLCLMIGIIKLLYKILNNCLHEKTSKYMRALLLANIYKGCFLHF